MGELTSLQGVGTATERKLQLYAGIQTIAEMAALADGEAEEVADVISVDVSLVEQWRDLARVHTVRDEVDKGDEDIIAPEYEPHDKVNVRVLCEQGLLAARAVWRGEVHQVAYWQYRQAVDANPDGYALIA